MFCLSCGGTPEELSKLSVESEKNELLQDAAHGGRAGFFWLPPLAPQPTLSGAPDGALRPRVEICLGQAEGDNCVCDEGAAPLVVAEATYQVEGGHYQYNWQLDGSPGCYRIRTMLYDQELGIRDLLVSEPPPPPPDSTDKECSWIVEKGRRYWRCKKVVKIIKFLIKVLTAHIQEYHPEWNVGNGGSSNDNGNGTTPSPSEPNSADALLKLNRGQTLPIKFWISEEMVRQHICEIGNVTVTQQNDTIRHLLTFAHVYRDPVLVMKPLSFRGVDPAHIRVTQVRPDSADFFIEEWAYLDGGHGSETVGYIVCEAGVHLLADGSKVEAGKLLHALDIVNGLEWAPVAFAKEFSTLPAIFSQTQTYNGIDPIVTRLRGTSPLGFEARIQEEENSERAGPGICAGIDGVHSEEIFGWIAIEPRVDALMEIGLTPTQVTHLPFSIAFSQAYQAPVLIADMQTYNGIDPVSLRLDSLQPTSAMIHIQEEASCDAETNHGAEAVGFMVFESQTTLNGMSTL